MRNKKLLVIGSTCVDVIIKLDHLPKTGEDMHPEWQHFAMGGCAYNVTKIPRGCGIDVTLVTPVGTEGVYSGFVKENLLKQGFKGPVTVDGAENGCCYCFVEKDGERTFVSVHGVEYSFHESYMDKLKGQSFDYTYICGLEVEEETGFELIEWLEKHLRYDTSDSLSFVGTENPDNKHDEISAGTLLYAPGPRGVHISPEKNERIFAMNPVLHLNEEEAMALSSEKTPEEAASKLQKKTRNLIVITLGEKGVLWMEKDGFLHRMPSKKAVVKDTIGAGDSHCGALLTGMCMEWTMDKTMSFANAISGKVVSREGASLPDAEIMKVYDELSSSAV
ncbi:MAG: carbohydrate kinase family protein [Oribacterium sp.]|nr:carbohydrate kinase family protein [Oribacterium sp.]